MDHAQREEARERANAERDLDWLIGLHRPVLSDKQIRELIQQALLKWSTERPHEAAAVLKHLPRCKTEYNASNKSAKTGLGEHFLGMFPEYVLTLLASPLYFNDPNWLTNNKKALGILFDEFEIGRFAYWEGSGRTGAGSRLNLNSADSA